MAKIHTVNPATEERLAEYVATSLEELHETLVRTRIAQKEWKGFAVDTRIEYFHKLMQSLEQHKESIAHIITNEVGKPLAESMAEIERCKVPFQYYLDHGTNLLRDEAVATPALKSYIRFEPIGLVAAFTPWNYPLWGVFRQLAPALLCGNGVIIKPSSQTVGSALRMLRIIQEAGLPQGLVSVVVGDEVTEPLIAGVETVVAITSSSHGRIIAELAGRYLKRVNLQLSGSDPFIVLEDVDIPLAVKRGVASRLINAGQDCVAAKRFVVRKEVYNDFVKLFVQEIRSAKIGNPLDPSNTLGPLGHRKLLDVLEAQVTDAVQKGARLLWGGKRMGGKGYFFPPTVLADAKPGMRIWQEETFGPVAAIMPVKSDADAIAMANHSPFGLGASIWTRDVSRGEAIAQHLEAGVVTVNEQPKSHPALPFGGLKLTGMGRDFSKYGLLHFLNTKTVHLYG